jgi:hypothetical protein
VHDSYTKTHTRTHTCIQFVAFTEREDNASSRHSVPYSRASGVHSGVLNQMLIGTKTVPNLLAENPPCRHDGVDAVFASGKVTATR